MPAAQKSHLECSKDQLSPLSPLWLFKKEKRAQHTGKAAASDVRGGGGGRLGSRGAGTRGADVISPSSDSALTGGGAIRRKPEHWSGKARCRLWLFLLF